MELIRGRWYKKYINCAEDKRDYDIMRRGFTQSHEQLATKWCDKFNPPELTDEEKREISEYWESFGIDIYDYNWHRMYYASTGIHDPRFVPDTVAGLVVYKYYNNEEFENTWRDKNMFSRLLPEIPLPQTYGQCIRNRIVVDGIYYDHNNDGINALAEKILDCINENNKNIIIKNTITTGFGRGVSKYTINNIEDIKNALEEWTLCENFIVQKCIRQHKILSAFNQSSSNMIRICSWRHGNDVDILFAAVRAGVTESVTDVVFIDGKELVNVIGISENGRISNSIYNQDGIKVREITKNMYIPSWDKIITIIKQNHLRVDNFDIIGWDFTVDEEGEPYCFEWNIQWPGTVLYQYVNGPLYGDKTDEILGFLKDENNRFNYIPYYMRK